MKKTAGGINQAKSNKQKLNRFWLVIVPVLIGLLLVAAGTFAFYEFNQNRFAGIQHLEEAGILGAPNTPSLDLASLESCSNPIEIPNNTPDPHYETHCFYMSVYNLRRQAFKLYIFKNEDAKIRYYGSDLSRHPCRSGHTPLIEAPLYVMRPEANLIRKQQRVEGIFDKLKEFDNQTLLLQKGQAGSEYTNCDDHIETLALKYRQIGAGSPRMPDTAMDQRCSELQAAVDSLYTGQPITPTNEAIADCLNLKAEIRQDFIDSLVIYGPDTDRKDHEWLANWGWYSPLSGPVIEWHKFDTAPAIALVALHEYLHKFYTENLSSFERIKLNQEILRLIDTDESGNLLPTLVFPQEQWDKLSIQEKLQLNPYDCLESNHILLETGLCNNQDGIYHNSQYSAFIDYLGLRSLNDEVMVRIGRHSPSPYSFSKLRQTFQDLRNNIFDRSEMIRKMTAALPEDIRLEYVGFLLDDYGLIALMRETKLIEYFEKLITELENEQTTSQSDTILLSEDMPPAEDDLLESTEAELEPIFEKFKYDRRLAFNLNDSPDDRKSLSEQLEASLLEHYNNYTEFDNDNDWIEELMTQYGYTQAVATNLNESQSTSATISQQHQTFSIKRLITLASCELDNDNDCEAESETAPVEYRECLSGKVDGNAGQICYQSLGDSSMIEICIYDYGDPDANSTFFSCSLFDENEEFETGSSVDEECITGVNPENDDDTIYCINETAGTACLSTVIDQLCIQIDFDETDNVPPSEQEAEDDSINWEEDQPSFSSETKIIRDIYASHTDAILSEGYPIIGLEVKERLPSWLEQHYSRFLEDRQKLADYFRRRS